jgi:diketogulonate reductase-like aldo/keto reductase
MEALAQAGKVRFLGISNVSLEQLAALYAKASIPPKFVQNRCYAKTGWDQLARAVCNRHGIIYQGFSLLTANRQVLAHRGVQDIAKRHGTTTAQIVFRFAQQVGVLPLTGTTKPEHMRQDLAIDGFTLSPDEVALIEAAG